MEQTIDIKNAYKLFWKLSFRMRGRANRLEFWIPCLINFIISAVLFALLTIIDALLGYSAEETSLFNDIVSSGFTIIVIPPSIAVTSRRLHDININGWWGLIPNLLLYVYLIAVVFEVYYCLSHPHFFDDTFVVLNIIGLLLVIVIYIVFIVLLSLKGQPHPNRYGEVRH